MIDNLLEETENRLPALVAEVAGGDSSAATREALVGCLTRATGLVQQMLQLEAQSNCARCGGSVLAAPEIRRFQDQSFHVDCFQCALCSSGRGGGASPLSTTTTTKFPPTPLPSLPKSSTKS